MEDFSIWVSKDTYICMYQCMYIYVFLETHCACSYSKNFSREINKIPLDSLNTDVLI